MPIRLFLLLPLHFRVAEPDDPDAKARSIQMTELKALCQAAEVERDRLIELVTVLQKR